MYNEQLQELGLSLNEARIYEVLLKAGEASVGRIAKLSNIHRRNIYDTLQRLIERGLVFEIRNNTENRFQAVDPKKLLELVEEKYLSINKILPSLEALFKGTLLEQRVFLYRGIEGWKNYMRDILRIGEDFYCIGAKGAWMDPRIANLFPKFIKDANKKNIKYFHLFDYEVKERKHEIVKHVGRNYKFFPKGYSAPAAVDIFGSHVNILSNIHVGGMDEDFSFTVIVNEQIADAFRTWFKFMYDFCPVRDKD